MPMQIFFRNLPTDKKYFNQSKIHLPEKEGFVGQKFTTDKDSFCWSEIHLQDKKRHSSKSYTVMNSVLLEKWADIAQMRQWLTLNRQQGKTTIYKRTEKICNC